MKPVILTPRQWSAIKKELHKEYAKPILALRSHMKKVLGFTPREHSAWYPNPKYQEEYSRYERDRRHSVFYDIEPAKGFTRHEIHLDFYSENKKTLFLLKFSDIINRINEDDGTLSSRII